MKIFHNPRCTKSRQTLQLLQEKGAEVEIVEYLKTPPTVAELTEVVKQLGIPAEKLLRKTEAIFKEQFKGQNHTDAEWIQIMVDHPKLIERPIVIKDGKAVIGRPPENVAVFF
ncbi:arsenate reductase (glutaredoxin) [Persicobacter sp. CCB-QB2]|uniref:arsenate reductase (glutaredoxin) n=1 Tax=Persicobacter sp. CCB-QB2 TaxID=1561025 RepID=UPI0006A9561A|nr:arsenate reductase (glutaredoxin) [Persicobacter sp. CCB-QB2]